MNKHWQTVALGEVLNRTENFEKREEFTEYHFAGTYSFARGIFASIIKSGSEFKLDKIQRVNAGNFVYCKIMAWEGAFGLVPYELDNYVMSGAFVAYEIDTSRLEPKFLSYFFKKPSTWQSIGSQSSGTNVRRQSLHPHQFEKAKISLPSLTEQRRIVARIEALVVKVEEVKRLRKEIIDDNQNMLLGVYHKLIENADYQPMTTVAPLIRRPVTEIDNEKYYPELGVRSFGNGTFHKASIKGVEMGTKRIYEFAPNDLVFSNVFAWEGAIAVAKQEDAGRFGSHRFITCVPKENLALSSFLAFHFLTRKGLEQIGDASPGGAGRNRTLGLTKLEVLKVPVPAIEKQQWFDGLLQKTNAIKQHQAETQQQLNALLPAILDRAFKGEL